MNYATLIEPTAFYPVIYTIGQGGKKVFKPDYLIGADLTEPQIKYLHECGYFEQPAISDIKEAAANEVTHYHVADNSDGFREWLKSKSIEYNPNGHYTSIPLTGNDIFRLCVEFGLHRQRQLVVRKEAPAPIRHDCTEDKHVEGCECDRDAPKMQTRLEAYASHKEEGPTVSDADIEAMAEKEYSWTNTPLFQKQMELIKPAYIKGAKAILQLLNQS